MIWRGSSGHPDHFGTPIFSVSEISGRICNLLDDDSLHGIWVRGEVTNYKDHASGHRYFSLSERDGRDSALINCAMWRSYAAGLTFAPGDGMDVLALGTVEVYEPHGKYQLIVRELRQAGAGDRHLMVERWKKELDAEGLSRSRRAPPRPGRPSGRGSPPPGSAGR